MKILSQYIPSILFMSGIYSIAVAILFFTYGQTIEKDVVKSNTESLLDSMTDDIMVVLSPKQKKSLTSHISNIKISQDVKKSDKEVDSRNKDVQNKAVKYISIFSIIAILVSLCLWYFGKLPYKEYGIEVVGKSFLFLAIIIIFQIIFFTLITKNYKSLDPSIVKNYIVEKLKKEYGN